MKQTEDTKTIDMFDQPATTYVVMAEELHTGRMREQGRFTKWADAHAFKRICQQWSTTVTIEEQTA